MPRKKKQLAKRGDTIKLIVKSNELVKARYMFDIWESRFFHTLVAKISKHDEDEKVYRIWFKDVKKEYDIKSNQSYSLLREAARSLNRKPVYIGWQKDEFRRGREYNLFEFVDYLEDGQSGVGVKKQEYVDIKIHSKMRPFLLGVKKNFNENTRYTSYDHRNIKKLNPYAIRFYEQFKQHEWKGFRIVNIEELKNQFLITNEYPRFSTLFQRVFKPSVKAINKYTDITIPIDEIIKIKEGRKVVALRCKILSKTKKEVAVLRGEFNHQPTLFDADIQEAEVIETIIEETEADLLFAEFEETVVKKFGVTPSVFLRMLNSGKYKKENIEQAINVTRRAKFKQDIKKNVAGFFISSLKDGYTDPKEEAKKMKKVKEEKAKQVKLLEENLADLRDEFSKVINERIRIITTENEEVTKNAIAAIRENPLTEVLIRTKEKSIGRKLGVEDFRKDERLRTMVISNIVQMQSEHFGDILSEYNPKIEELKKEIKELSE